jgi:hypothetical protein
MIGLFGSEQIETFVDLSERQDIVEQPINRQTKPTVNLIFTELAD